MHDLRVVGTELSAKWGDARGFGGLNNSDFCSHQNIVTSHLIFGANGCWSFGFPRKISGRNCDGFVLVCVWEGTELYLVARADLNFWLCPCLRLSSTRITGMPHHAQIFFFLFGFPLYCLIIKHLSLARKVGLEQRLSVRNRTWMHLTHSHFCSTYLASKQKWNILPREGTPESCGQISLRKEMQF